MKKFETPVIEVAQFNVADVITTSGQAGDVYETDRD